MGLLRAAGIDRLPRLFETEGELVLTDDGGMNADSVTQSGRGAA